MKPIPGTRYCSVSGVLLLLLLLLFLFLLLLLLLLVLLFAAQHPPDSRSAGNPPYRKCVRRAWTKSVRVTFCAAVVQSAFGLRLFPL